MDTYLGCFPDITLHKCDCTKYSDCELFGNYLMGNEVFGIGQVYQLVRVD